MKTDGKLLHEQWGFAAWRGWPAAMPSAHTHIEVELNLMLRGAANYFLAGRFVALRCNRLAVFWAGQPHQLIHTAARTEFIWVTVPLAWVLQWRIRPSFVNRLLGGELLEAPDVSPEDALLLDRWIADLQSGSAERRRIVLLELEARLRRLALAAAAPPAAPSGATPDAIEQLTRFISRHYLEELSVPQIAAAARLHPNYAIAAFKRATGMSLWDYVLRLRVSHAQLLLLTTDAKILDIAFASGFNSASRFYATFQRYTGRTPQAYRWQFTQRSR